MKVGVTTRGSRRRNRYWVKISTLPYGYHLSQSVSQPVSQSASTHHPLTLLSLNFLMRTAASRACVLCTELADSVHLVTMFNASVHFQALFYTWAMAQLDVKQSTSTLTTFLRSWLVSICDAEQVLAWWGKAIDTVNSWSFLLGTLADAVRWCEKDERLHALVMRKFEEEPLMQQRNHWALVHRLVAHHWPKLVVAKIGIQRYLNLVKKPKPQEVGGSGRSRKSDGQPTESHP